MRLLENSNTLSLYNSLNEDFFNPCKYMEIIQGFDIDADKWNSTNSQAERDAMVRPQLEEFWKKYGNEIIENNMVETLFDDLEDCNYHTEYRLLRDIIEKDSMKGMNESENMINKDQEDFEELVLRDFLIYLDDRYGVETLEDAERVRHNVSNKDINDYFTGLFPEIFDYDDEETAIEAEKIIRNKYGILDSREPSEPEYDDGDTNWTAEEEADATERLENKYGSMNEAKKPKNKQDTRVVMQQGNVTCIKENDTYLVFENEADNEVEHETEDSAMQDFLERVGIDANTELEDKENK